MKKITLLFVSLWLMTAFVIAQIPQAFKYQAVARTSSGNLIQNQLVAFRISILQGGPSGTLLYQERHTTNTNNYGLANLDIGNGTVLSGIFSSINWSLGQMYIKVELDPLGGTAYQNMGTMQLLSVPYALHSNTSAGLTLPYSGTGSSSKYIIGNQYWDRKRHFRNSINLFRIWRIWIWKYRNRWIFSSRIWGLWYMELMVYLARLIWMVE